MGTLEFEKSGGRTADPSHGKALSISAVRRGRARLFLFTSEGTMWPIAVFIGYRHSVRLCVNSRAVPRSEAEDAVKSRKDRFWSAI